MKREDLSIAASRPVQRNANAVLGWLNRWHQKLAWVAGVAVLFWGLTGVLHPIMSALTPAVQPLPAPAALPVGLMPVPVDTLALPQAKLQSVRLRMLGNVPAWRIGLVGEAQGRWFDARTGAALPLADQLEAERLARALVGDQHSALRRMELVTAFSRSYPSINKILPVWRVEFARDDGMVAFVDTEGARLASLSDRTKRTLMPLFSSLHTWSWASEPVKLFGITALLGVALLSMGGGLAMYVIRWRKQTLKASQAKLRRLHRGLGVTVGVAGIVITASGLTHLWLQRPVPQVAAPAPLAELPALHHIGGQWRSLTAVNVDGVGYWLVDKARKDATTNTSGGHQHHAATPKSALPEYVNEHGIAQPGVAEKHAVQLVGATAGLALTAEAVKSVTLITTFGGEYGFFQKRLPVYRVDLANAAQSSWYVEAATGAFSSRVENADRFEGYLFANLHKWHWLDGLGKTSRDVILASFAALNVVLAVMGLCLLRRRKVLRP
ncbi:hypothetical protein HQ393_10655 [Chitinibacter bivalviorum]|uniref:PepSY domain-containing protein n=1 Tax=Chitinibacter bivalviorum TaxID=2739434 RepID=A0A7H9BJW9_9NEIS|nr:hypothetical protein [Chitinibacter bivalviorum]QLG88662.1 hypothetical protein HQ393_10655 [Chitinibacter bivalviorum]